ncbi:MAG: HIT domain-containing protein [Verrucomicrobia bacterium]|nr:HIT domain-containing protein [Verrucomicrobiota bacterium]
MSLPIDQDFIWDKSSHYELFVPEKPLAPHSLQVRGNENYGEMFDLLQKAAAQWDDFFIYTSRPSLTEWEFIPYTRESYAWTQQFSVLWSVIRGAAAQSTQQRSATLERYKVSPVATSHKIEGRDAFCDPQVIERQRIFSKGKVEILFNYAPQGDEHFLIVPKAHRTDFRDLQRDEFVEAMESADKIVRHYLSKGLNCYLFHKTGSWAGQTVPHWHLHIVVVDPSKDFAAKLGVGWRMLFGARPLPPDILKGRVEMLQVELTEFR